MVHFPPSAALATHPKFPLTAFVAFRSLGIEIPALCFQIFREDGLSQGTPSKSVTVSLFGLLFEMRKLQKVDLSGMHWVTLGFGDKEFSKFASAWPALQELDFSLDFSVLRMNANIQSFATKFPRPRRLTISFDGQAVRQREHFADDIKCSGNAYMVGDTGDELHLAWNHGRSDTSLDTLKEWVNGGKKLLRAFQTVRAAGRAR